MYRCIVYAHLGFMCVSVINFKYTLISLYTIPIFYLLILIIIMKQASESTLISCILEALITFLSHSSLIASVWLVLLVFLTLAGCP